MRCSNAVFLVALVGCATAQTAPRLSPRTVSPALETYPRLVLTPAHPSGIVGDTILMHAQYVGPGHGDPCAPEWKSLNPEVASIDAGGRLIVHRAGSTTIQAWCDDVAGGTTAAFGAKP